LGLSLSKILLHKIPNIQDISGNSLVKIFYSLGSPRYLMILLVFLVLYRLPDNFINAMINPFLLHTGFDAAEIATVGKFLGIMAAILGGLIASRIMHRVSALDSLLYFGVAHALAHSMFIALDMAGHNLPLLFIVMGFESITGGMVMAAYIAYITSLCSGKYRATQYAILSSMMGLSRAILPGISGFIVSEYGWQIFYLFASIATIPSLCLLRYMRSPA
jgi:PAT family beta-lactamase induction signal transducer AmpG